MKTPLASEFTVGVQRELGPTTVLTLDGVWARGWRLLAGHDLNSPDAPPGFEPGMEVLQIS